MQNRNSTSYNAIEANETEYVFEDNLADFGLDSQQLLDAVNLVDNLIEGLDQDVLNSNDFENNNNNNNNEKTNSNSENRITRKRKPKIERDAESGIVYFNGDTVDEATIADNQIDWNNASCGILKIFDKETKKVIEAIPVFKFNYWKKSVQVVYADKCPKQEIKKEDYPRLQKVSDKKNEFMLDDKLVITKAKWDWRHRELSKKNFNALSLDSINQLEHLYGKNIPAVFDDSGKDIPENCKPIWTFEYSNAKEPDATKRTIGFIELNGEKHKVVSLKIWEMNKSWYTPDGIKLERREYDNVIKENNEFFLEVLQPDKTIQHIPLKHKQTYLSNLSNKLNPAVEGVKVIAFEIDADKRTINPEDTVYAHCGFLVPDKYNVQVLDKSFCTRYIKRVENNTTEKTKVAKYKYYRDYLALVYADVPKYDPVNQQDCLRINLDIKPMVVNGREVVTKRDHRKLWKGKKNIDSNNNNNNENNNNDNNNNNESINDTNLGNSNNEGVLRSKRRKPRSTKKNKDNNNENNINDDNNNNSYGNINDTTPDNNNEGVLTSKRRKTKSTKKNEDNNNINDDNSISNNNAENTNFNDNTSASISNNNNVNNNNDYSESMLSTNLPQNIHLQENQLIAIEEIVRLQSEIEDLAQQPQPYRIYTPTLFEPGQALQFRIQVLQYKQLQLRYLLPPEINELLPPHINARQQTASQQNNQEDYNENNNNQIFHRFT